MFIKLQAIAMLASCKVRVMLMNVSEMLDPNKKGAAGEGGALNEVDKLVNDYGQAGYSIISTAFVYIVGIGMILACIAMFVHSSNQQKLGEAKSSLGWKFVAAVLGFGGVSIIIFMQTIGSSLLNNTATP